MTVRKQPAQDSPNIVSSRDSKRARRSSPVPLDDQQSATDNASSATATSGSPSPINATTTATAEQPTVRPPAIDGHVGSQVLIPTVRPHATPVDPSDLTFLPDEAEYIPDSFTSRLTGIINFSEADTNHYNIGLVPPAATWGAAGGGSGLDRYLCYRNKPVIVWMVGVVTSAWLAPTEGSRASIGLRLLCQRDMDAAKYLQFRLCNPPSDATHANVSTYAARYLAPRGQEIALSFDDVYDGTDRLVAWSEMPLITHTKIRKTDIVVAEVYVKRFRHRDSPSRFAWGTWGVSFELLRIALLHSGPGPVDIVPEDSRVNL